MRQLAAPLAALLILASGPSLATASEQWCNGDPVVVIRTPGGNLVPVYVTSSAPGPKYLANVLAARISYTASSAASGKATQVKMDVTVPTALFDGEFSTRTAASSGPLRTGVLYATASGRSGKAMHLVFNLNVPSIATVR